MTWPDPTTGEFAILARVRAGYAYLIGPTSKPVEAPWRVDLTHRQAENLARSLLLDLCGVECAYGDPAYRSRAEKTLEGQRSRHLPDVAQHPLVVSSAAQREASRRVVENVNAALDAGLDMADMLKILRGIADMLERDSIGRGEASPS